MAAHLFLVQSVTIRLIVCKCYSNTIAIFFIGTKRETRVYTMQHNLTPKNVL